MITHPVNPSVTEPLNQAFERVKLVLFQPFDIGKWFVIGFCAWLATLGEGGGGGFSFPVDSNNSRPQNPVQVYEHGRNYVLENLHWLIPLVIAIFVFVVLLVLVIEWVKCRGKFMLLHCVALNKAEIAVPWNKYARQGNSLLLFQIVLHVIGMFITLPLVVMMIVPIIGMVMAGAANPGGIFLSALALLFLLLSGIFFALIRKFTLDFVVPIMYLRGNKCMEAWREFRPLLMANAGQFALYILFQIVLAMVIGTMIILIVLLTCCIAGCFLMLPYLGTVLLLPVIVFSRAYSLHYLAQYGPAYDVFGGGLPPSSPLPTAVGTI